MRKSLKQVVTDIKDWTSNHPTLKEFNYGDIDMLFKSENHKYQMLWLTDIGAGMIGESYQAQITFKLLVMDVVNSSNELDVLSDCLQVVFDFLNEFTEDADEDYGWFILPENVTAEPFRETLNDKVSGYALNFTVNCGGGLPCKV